MRTEKGEAGGAGPIHPSLDAPKMPRWHTTPSRRHVTEVPRCTDHTQPDTQTRLLPTSILITTNVHRLFPFFLFPRQPTSSQPSLPSTLL